MGMVANNNTGFMDQAAVSALAMFFDMLLSLHLK